MSSAFVTYSRNFGKLNMEAGLRYENVDFKYYDDGKYMADQSKNYSNWFPSLSLSMPFGDVQMQLSYAADINRPNYWVLRSGVQYSNHYTYETGNPFLFKKHKLRLGLQIKRHFVFPTLCKRLVWHKRQSYHRQIWKAEGNCL